MKHHPALLQLSALWLAGFSSAFAQTAATTETSAASAANSLNLDAVVVQGTRPQTPRQNSLSSFDGFHGAAVQDAPAQVGSHSATALQSANVQGLAGISKLEPSVVEAYSAPGYWEQLAIRGFVVGNKTNYRRDGLPINAETTLPLENAERLEILHGLSGAQAGASDPGGLVNFVVKRPTPGPLHQLTVGFSERGTTELHADLSQRFGQLADSRASAQPFGLRVNAATQTYRPQIEGLKGERQLLAVAADWRLTPGSRLDADIEWSKRSQASQAPYSLWGTTQTVPAVPHPNQNLNRQSWSAPSTFEGLTGSVRFSQKLSANPQGNWRWSAALGQQRLKSDDRAAFPFGCSAEGNYANYCADGSHDLYDYRSLGERRTTRSAQLKIDGSVQLLGLRHDLSASVLTSRYRFSQAAQYAYNWVGVGAADGYTPLSALPADPTPTAYGVNSAERSRELALSSRSHLRFLSPRTQLWAGLRVSSSDKTTAPADPSLQATQSRTRASSPWLALTHDVLTPNVAGGVPVKLYAAWGTGSKEIATPNNPLAYSNYGQSLGLARQKQLELGVRGGVSWRSEQIQGTATEMPPASPAYSFDFVAFQITQPRSAADYDAATGLNTLQLDGRDQHRGVSLKQSLHTRRWQHHAHLTWLHAKSLGSVLDPAQNGKRPVNVPALVASLGTEYRFASPALQGWSASANALHQSRRFATRDNTVRIPAWTRWDLALKYVPRSTRGGLSDEAVDSLKQGVQSTNALSTPSNNALLPTLQSLQISVDNALNKRYWRESPLQFDHHYLYPATARTVRVVGVFGW